MDPVDVPDPKAIQKATKIHLKGIRIASKTVDKASKLAKIRSHRNKNYKIPMQRTAEDLAPYQSFPTKRNQKIGTMVGGAAHRVHRGIGIIHKDQLKNPNAKACKEPAPHQTVPNAE